MDAIPGEILELFLESIDESGQGRITLCVCMLVSRRFFRPARNRLFSSVEFKRSSINIGLRLKIFCKLLEYNSAGYLPLGPCIKSLTLDWPASRLTPNSDSEPLSQESANSIKHDILMLLASTSCSIRKLSINFGMAQFPDASSDPHAYHALRTIFSAPNLRSLSLLWVRGVPSDTLDIFKFEEFHAEAAYFVRPQYRRSEPTGKSTLSREQLREATLSNSTLPLEWFQNTPCPNPFSRLKSLDVNLGTWAADHPGPSNIFDTYLSACQHTLERLKIHIVPDFSVIYPHSLHQMTELRELVYVARYGHNRHGSDGGTQGLSWAMESIIWSLTTMHRQDHDAVPSVISNLQRIMIYIPINLSDHRLGKVVFEEDKDSKTRELMDVLSAQWLVSVKRIEVVLHLYGKQKGSGRVVHPLPGFASWIKDEHPRVVLRTTQSEEYREFN